MKHHLHILDPTSSTEWMSFVNRHPDARIFHHPAWMRLIRDSYGYPMFAVCLTLGGEIVAGIPFADVHSSFTGKRWISLPFSDHCPPLLPPNDPCALSRLIEFLKQRSGSKSHRIEIHSNVAASGQIFRVGEFVQHILQLNRPADELFTKFEKRTTQRSIRIAEKSRIVVRECKTSEDFEAFYALHWKTRRRLGVPVQPKSLFIGLWHHVLQPGLGYCLVAHKNERPVAGGVFLKFNNTIAFKYSASDDAYKASCPSHAFLWEGIKRGIADGCTTLDFGRTDKGNCGLRRFKNNWGATEEELIYTAITDRPPTHRSPMLDKILRQVIRHSPQIVCRAAGEVLYKHFA
ncbi:MAG: GNAT family N-acetyltransferase [Bacteroidetes bacterium]|nr:GNAT family N-acetyltransferase [Bacteroidota bacterium]MCW5894422.1 GNAT family N-acetyltransferase [Bacteroidota bacterium]